MEKYINSGIEWIGSIPREWKICRLKDIGYLYGGLTGKSGSDFDVEEGDKYALFIPFTNIFNNDVIDPSLLQKVKVDINEVQNEVKEGDLLFLMSSEDYDGIGKPSILQSSISKLYLNSFCKGMRITNPTVLPKYLFYQMSSHFVREQLRLEAKGFIRINLRQDKLLSCSIFLPPIAEQQRIAEYLDIKCGEIDRLIALQEQMITQLTDYKQSVITEAVTKGLNPDVRLVPSGIDWIGEIPMNWKVIRGKYLFSILNGFAFDSNMFTDDKSYMPLIRIRDINSIKTEAFYTGNYNEEYVVNKGDILIGMDGDFNVAKWKGEKALLNQRVCKINKFTYSVCSGFIFYILPLLLKRKNDVTYSTTVKHLSSNDVLNFEFIVPTYQESIIIAEYLDAKCSEIDKLIEMKRQKIETLKVYKKSVIYEAVTCKAIIE